MIEARLKKRYGLFFLDAQISDEKFICLTGRNGSGKTTFLNIVAGVLRPDEGEVKLNSKLVTNLAPEKRNVVLVTPESYIPHLEVEKHLLWGAKLKGAHVNQDHLARVKSDLGINYKGKLAKLSLGMKERVALATALLSKPEAILVDEVFSNIDNRNEFVGAFRELASKSGIDTIFTTQYVEDSSLADHHYNLDSGKSSRVF